MFRGAAVVFTPCGAALMSGQPLFQEGIGGWKLEGDPPMEKLLWWAEASRLDSPFASSSSIKNIINSLLMWAGWILWEAIISVEWWLPMWSSRHTGGYKSKHSWRHVVLPQDWYNSVKRHHQWNMWVGQATKDWWCWKKQEILHIYHNFCGFILQAERPFDEYSHTLL